MTRPADLRVGADGDRRADLRDLLVGGVAPDIFRCLDVDAGGTVTVLTLDTVVFPAPAIHVQAGGVAARAALRPIVSRVIPTFGWRVRLPFLLADVPLCREHPVYVAINFVEKALHVAPGPHHVGEVVHREGARCVLTGELDLAHVFTLIEVRLDVFRLGFLQSQRVTGIGVVAGDTAMAGSTFARADVIRLSLRIWLGCGSALALALNRRWGRE